MTSFHEIIIIEAAGRFRVTVAPAMPNKIPDRFFDDHGRAMAFARLLRLEHAFRIVDMPTVASPNRERR